MNASKALYLPDLLYLLGPCSPEIKQLNALRKREPGHCVPGSDLWLRHCRLSCFVYPSRQTASVLEGIKIVLDISEKSCILIGKNVCPDFVHFVQNESDASIYYIFLNNFPTT